jgi:hypothetical protein
MHGETFTLIRRRQLIERARRTGRLRQGGICAVHQVGQDPDAETRDLLRVSLAASR